MLLHCGVGTNWHRELQLYHEVVRCDCGLDHEVPRLVDADLPHAELLPHLKPYDSTVFSTAHIGLFELDSVRHAWVHGEVVVDSGSHSSQYCSCTTPSPHHIWTALHHVVSHHVVVQLHEYWIGDVGLLGIGVGWKYCTVQLAHSVLIDEFNHGHA